MRRPHLRAQLLPILSTAGRLEHFAFPRSQELPDLLSKLQGYLRLQARLRPIWIVRMCALDVKLSLLVVRRCHPK